MPRQTDRRNELQPDAGSVAFHARRIGIISIVLVMITGSLVAGVSGAAVAQSEETDDPAVDVVFVFDSSESTDNNRYHMAQEIDGLSDRLDSEGIDARYGLVTYNATVRTEQEPTADFEKFDRAMHFSANGSEERASDAILEATTLDLRDDAETVVVVVTDEDDDSDNATRTEAMSALGDHHLISVAPATPHRSSCALHSPPCDNRTDNELRTMTEDVGGSYIDIDNDAETIVDRIGDETESLVTTERTRTRSSSSSSSSSSPHFETESVSINRTDAEVGDPVEINKTITNTGTAHGTYEAYLSYEGTILQERSVRIHEGQTRTISFVHRFAEPGERELIVTHEVAGMVNVTPPRDASVGTAVANNTTRLNATISDAQANGSVSTPLSNASLSMTEGVTLETATVSIGDVDATPSHDVAFEFSVAANGTPPAGVEPLPDHVDNGTYLTVTDSLPAGHSEVGFGYTAQSTDVTLYRYDANASTWIPLDRTSDAGSDTEWQTDASNASNVAIGVRQPATTVSSMTLADSAVTTGEETAASVTVANDGLAEGVHDVELTVNGTTVAAESVPVPAGETRRVDFQFTPETPGQHTVAVAGVSPQMLEVEQVTTEASKAAATSEPTATPSEPASNSITGVGNTGITVTVALAVLVGGTILRRRT